MDVLLPWCSDDRGAGSVSGLFQEGHKVSTVCMTVLLTLVVEAAGTFMTAQVTHFQESTINGSWSGACLLWPRDAAY